MSHPLVLSLQVPFQKSAVFDLLLISSQLDQEVLSLYHQKGRTEFETLPEIKTDNVSVE